jgi:rhodanese-related sulfurtransferase
MRLYLNIVAFALALSIVSCKASAPVAPDLSPAAAAAMMAAESALQIVDVRYDSEWAEGRLAGARQIVLDELPKRLNELDPSKPVLVYCATGGRSSTALGILKKAGFKQAAHLAGGITAWQAEGRPLTR